MIILATITCRLYRNAQIWATADYSGHTGQDIVHYGDKLVLNLLAGTVIQVYTNTGTAGYGVAVQTTQATFNGRNVSGTIVRYYHFSKMPYVTVGQSVSIGTVLGHEGSTGNSTGSHCHVEWESSAGAKDLDEPFITGVPYQPIGSGGTLYDNDYNPDPPDPPDPPYPSYKNSGKIFIYGRRINPIYGKRF